MLTGFPHCRGRKVLAAPAARRVVWRWCWLWGTKLPNAVFNEACATAHLFFLSSTRTVSFYFAFKNHLVDILQQSKVGYYAFAACWRIMLSVALLGPVTLFTIVARLRIKQATKVLVLVTGIILSASISHTYVFLYMFYSFSNTHRLDSISIFG